MKNKEIASLLTRMGNLLELKEENVFKVRAYYKAAENIDQLAEDIELIKKENRLSDVPGIGKALQEKIVEYLDAGRMSAYEKLIQEIPESILDVIHIPSIGPKKAKLFFDKLNVKDVDSLCQAAEDGRLSTLPGIKEKTVENILNGIKIFRQGQERMNLGTATQASESIVDALKKSPKVKKIIVAGSLRRMRETVRDIDILIDSPDPAGVMEAFVKLPQVKNINAYGETKSSVLIQDNIQVDLRVVEPKCFGAALLYFTGSKNFNVKLRQIALKRNMKVNEYGIFAVKGASEKFLAGKTEQECLAALELPYIPPELREDIGENELLRLEKLPNLIENKDIKGDLHVHSTWSDGHHSMAEMAEAARARGYQYIAISDHSRSLKIAGGLASQDIKKKKKEIDKLNAGYNDFRILLGTEVEIDTDGNLDYNTKILSEFDVVIAAIHTGFELSREKMTRRILKACRHKNVHIIAHPLGVHIGKRDPYDIDFKEICKAAVNTNTFLEINAFPHRLDLNSSNTYFARSQGVRCVINSDAHTQEHLDFMKFGVAIARRGWLTKRDVLNTSPLRKMLTSLRK